MQTLRPFTKVGAAGSMSPRFWSVLLSLAVVVELKMDYLGRLPNVDSGEQLRRRCANGEISVDEYREIVAAIEPKPRRQTKRRETNSGSSK